MSTAPIRKPEEAFLPMIGRHAWSVSRTHGTFLTLEFGAPHLEVREPVVASSDSLPTVKRLLARRRVFVVGDWHFWVKYGHWEIRTANHLVRSEEAHVAQIEEAVQELDGQILLSVAPGAAPNSCVLKFDLGGSLYIWPSTDVGDDQWSIYPFNGNIISYQMNGSISEHSRAE